ncbi:MAG: PQQ-binding-like beta-propeller repeat protein [Acidobacteriota bacterium]
MRKPYSASITGTMTITLTTATTLLLLSSLVAPAIAAEEPAAPKAAEAQATSDEAPSATAPSDANGSDWPSFLGPTGDGKSSEPLRTDWPLPILWHKKIGDGYSMPSVADGKLYVFGRHGDRARLSSWQSTTGEELWRSEYATDYEDYYGYSTGPRASPVIDEDRVYTFGVGGMLRAHRTRDGELLWQVDTTADFGVVQNFFGAGSTPIVEGDLLITMVGGSPPDSPKIHSGDVRGNGSGIVAFDKRTGKVRYKMSDELASYASPVLATVDGRRWGFAFTRGGLLGFAPDRGTQEFFFPWRAKKLESVNAANPVVVDDTVFITESYGPGSALLKFAPGKHEVVWQDPPRGKAMESHWSTPIYLDGHLYGSSGQSGGNAELRAIEHATGKVTWSEPGLQRSTLLYADGHFVVLTERGRLLLVRATPEKFDRVAEMDLGDAAATKPQTAAGTQAAAKTGIDTSADDRPVLRFPAWNAPILSRGLLYVRGKDQLICLDARPN